MGKNFVLCLCCNQHVPRQREREHRKRMALPHPANTAKIPSQQCHIVSFDLDHPSSAHPPDHVADDACNELATSDSTCEDDDPQNRCETPGSDQGGTIESEPPEINIQTIIRQRWAQSPWVDDEHDEQSDCDSDNENTEESSLDYGIDDDGAVDWAAIERGSGLSAWDQLGAQYQAEAADVSEWPLRNKVCIDS